MTSNRNQIPCELDALHVVVAAGDDHAVAVGHGAAGLVPRHRQPARRRCPRVEVGVVRVAQVAVLQVNLAPSAHHGNL